MEQGRENRRPAAGLSTGSPPGSEPDYRFTLANERTFLAWARTTLAILAGAMVLHQLGPFAPAWAHRIATASLALLCCALSAGAYRQWQRNQRAMRLGQPLPGSRLVPLLTTAIALLGGGALMLFIGRP